MAEWSRDRSSSSESQPKFPGCSHIRRRNDNHYRCQQCRMNEGLTLCTQVKPCFVCKDWLPEACEAQAKASAQKTRRKATAAAKAAKKASERETMDDSVEIHAPEETLQLLSKRASSDGSSKSKRTKTKATSSGSRATEAEKSAARPSMSREPKSVVSSVSEVGRPSSDGSDRHRSRSLDRKRRHGANKRQDSPRHQSSRRDSRRREGERSCPSSSGGSSSRRRAESSSVSKASDTRPSASSSHHRHHQSSGDRRSLSSSSSRASPDRKSLPSHHERRRESADRTGPSYVARREVQHRKLTSRHQWRVQRRWRTARQVTARPQLTAWPQLTARPVTARQGTALPVTARRTAWPQLIRLTAQLFSLMTRRSRTAQHAIRRREWTGRHAMEPRQEPHQRVDQTSPCWQGPAVHFSRQYRPPSTRQRWSTLCLCGHYYSDGWTRVWFQIPRPARLYSLQCLLPDMTQHPGDQTRRLDRTPERCPRTPKRFLRTPESRPRTPQRFPRMPVRRVRMPVRQARGDNDSRESRSRSPVSRSSSVESPTRDVSPVNFFATLDPDDKRSISDDEDDGGEHKKISAAQYQIFRQAVTTSKGSFKVNPAKTKRASRASLLDLGGPEVTDRVSWLDQPSPQDTMVSTARIAQGLKDDKEVEKTTLSETLNTASSTFKFFTVKQIFPREPYRRKVHRDALYVPKPPGDHGFSDNKAPSSYQVSHRMCLDTEELARRSAIYASLADSMVASVIEELSPKDERSKLLREKLAIIQEAQVSAVSAGFAATSNLQLLRRDALLKNFGFQPQVFFSVRTAPFEGNHVVGPEAKVLQNRVRTIRQADRMAGSSVTFAQKHREPKTSTKVTSSKKTASRTSVFERLGSPTSTTQRTVTQEPPFRARAGRARQRPFQEVRKKPGKASSSTTTRQRWRVGARLANFAPHWRSLLGNCRATGIVEDGVGIAFKQRPQLTHQSISFRTRNSRQDLQQAVDALLMKGAIERVTNVTSLGFYSRLFLVHKKTGDLRPVIDLSTLNRHMVVPHFKMETQGSVRSAIRSQEWTVSIDIRDAYLLVPMHQAVRKYLRFMVNKKVYQFTCLPFGLVTSSREFTKLLRPVVTLLRQQGVKLQVYLDDWLIRADTPEQAQLHAQTTIRVLQFLGWIINFEKANLTPSQDFQFIGMQFNTRRFTVAPLPKMRLKVQSVHQHWMTDPNITARDLHRLLGMLVVMASLVQRGWIRFRSVQWWATTAWCQRAGNWSDRIQVPQSVLSEMAWWSSPAVLQGLPLVTKETEVTLYTDASSSGWGAQLGSRSTQGQWSASQRS